MVIYLLCIIKYSLILSVYLGLSLILVGCGNDLPSDTYVSPFSNTVNTRNTDIINKSSNTDEITVEYDMDKETDSFINESIKDMEHRGYVVSKRKVVESYRILSTNPDVFHTVVEYQIITYKKSLY